MAARGPERGLRARNATRKGPPRGPHRGRRPPRAPRPATRHPRGAPVPIRARRNARTRAGGRESPIGRKKKAHFRGPRRRSRGPQAAPGDETRRPGGARGRGHGARGAGRRGCAGGARGGREGPKSHLNGGSGKRRFFCFVYQAGRHVGELHTGCQKGSTRRPGSTKTSTEGPLSPWRGGTPAAQDHLSPCCLSREV